MINCMESAAMKKKNNRIITYILLVLAIGMCIYGAVTGEMQTVLTKAINICMECIGLG